MGQDNNSGNTGKGKMVYSLSSSGRVIVGVLLVMALVGLTAFFMGFFTKTPTSHMTAGENAMADADAHSQVLIASSSHEADKAEAGAKEAHGQQAEADSHGQTEAAAQKTNTPSWLGASAQPAASQAEGVAFVTATINPLQKELDRFYGWRPNDIIDVTDNVNNFQLGVLEVTRRTVERLVDNISRTGSTAAFDKNLENARSTCFVVEAERYMFPSPEGKYEDGLDELRRYREKLKKGEGTFYTRADNLIPLLVEYENLLGSCDDNLVKAKESNGTDVSFFVADDYFYYAQGVANTMAQILEAIKYDFRITLERRNCMKDLDHAVESLHHASHIHPWVIMDSDLDSFFANHRANLAAHISHGRFYVNVLIKTLST